MLSKTRLSHYWSYNRHEEKHNRLVLSVFAREVNFVEEQDESLPVNQIYCKDGSLPEAYLQFLCQAAFFGRPAAYR